MNRETIIFEMEKIYNIKAEAYFICADFQLPTKKL
jgi:hypothetical protein